MKFKSNQKVVFIDENIPNNTVMTIKKGNHNRSGMTMVSLNLKGGVGIAFVDQIRLATPQEEKTGFRDKGVNV